MLIFSYGTLTEPLIRDRVLGRHVEARDAVLRGHSKVCGWDYLTLVPSDGSVAGKAFEADEGDVRLMDIWEEVPVYTLQRVTVTIDGVDAEAHAYIMPEPPEHYEFVDDDCIAAIPIREIMAELESVMSRARRRAGGWWIHLF